MNTLTAEIPGMSRVLASAGGLFFFKSGVFPIPQYSDILESLNLETRFSLYLDFDELKFYRE